MRQGLVDVQKNNRALDLERQIHRKWKAGDVYAPHDLSSIEMDKWRKRRPRERDVFDQLGINPLHEYKVCKALLKRKEKWGFLCRVADVRGG